MPDQDLILVTGAGGFIGGHLVAELRRQGLAGARRRHQAGRDMVSAVSGRRQPGAGPPALDACRQAVAGAASVYNLAADMGGMGFIESHKARMHADGAHQHAHADGRARRPACRALLLCVVRVRVRRGQADARRRRAAARSPTPIRPCPRTGTAGKSCSANACAGTSARTSVWKPASRAITTSTVRTARTTAGARRRRRRSAARSSRQSSLAPGEIEIWGDGEQTRSFMYIDDCLHGTATLMASDVRRAAQYRQRRTGHDQPARRHRRGDRRCQVEAPVQARRSERRARAQQRQHA